jgi:hypothetical protein
MFVGWGDTIPERELKSLEVFQEALAYWTRLEQEGTIESFDTVALSPHSGKLAGFAVIKGDPDKLSSVWRSDEFSRLNARAQLVIQHFGVVDAYVGDDLTNLYGVYAQAATELLG